ncbi:MAG: phytoene desaturase family protein [Christiangramia sp.]|uniref:phytoene desaturase family protein n=1 Tax=Christiangramia sp. TaxID=1931228 RepID=UPI0032428E32
MPKTINIIGSGFSALSASCYLAQAGYEVHIFEKNDTVGGRARQYKKDGFTFDIGPTWYWMPDVFERFFQDFGKSAADFYQLEKLDPAYEVYFGKDDSVVIPAGLENIYQNFEAVETGSSEKLREFITKARDNYDIAIKDLVYRPGVSPLELVTPATITRLGRFFTNISSDVGKDFRNDKLRQILEFPVLFLGAKPSDTPAFYSFMNYADFGLGTWHPKGGMYSVIEGIQQLAESLGVHFHLNSPVNQVILKNNKACGVIVGGKEYHSDIVLSGADYHHSEELLPKKFRQYSEAYWDKKTFAPSSLLFYVGFDKKLQNVSHHTLFFDSDFQEHAKDIYDHPKWPENPLFYASFPSLTDDSCAPEGKEAGIFLIPLAPDLEDTEELRNYYFKLIIRRFEQLTGQKVENNVIFKKSFCVNDFKEAYNSYKGNAYGMANTLFQTAFLRPKIKSKRVNQLYFTGQLTVPGPGVPPSLISGKLAAGLIEKNEKN